MAEIPDVIIKVYGLLIGRDLLGKKILLIHRPNKAPYTGMCGFPGGHIENGESIFQALKREVREEVNLEIFDPQFAHILYRKKKEKDKRIYMFFIIEDWSGELKNMEPEKADFIEWVDICSLPNNIVPYLKDILEKINQDILYSEIDY